MTPFLIVAGSLSTLASWVATYFLVKGWRSAQSEASKLYMSLAKEQLTLEATKTTLRVVESNVLELERVISLKDEEISALKAFSKTILDQRDRAVDDLAKLASASPEAARALGTGLNSELSKLSDLSAAASAEGRGGR